jgi:hypothetical protein
VKFTGYISGFSQCLDEVLTKKYCSASDSFYMHDELNKILTKRLKNNEILGEGTLAKVLKIDSKYAMRIAKGYKSVVDGFDRTFKPFHEGLDFKTYYGGYVAKFGDVQILKNVSATAVTMSILGEPIGTCILAYFILSETISLQQFVGIAVILAGLGIFFTTKKE